MLFGAPYDAENTVLWWVPNVGFTMNMQSVPAVRQSSPLKISQLDALLLHFVMQQVSLFPVLSLSLSLSCANSSEWSVAENSSMKRCSSSFQLSTALHSLTTLVEPFWGYYSNPRKLRNSFWKPLKDDNFSLILLFIISQFPTVHFPWAWFSEGLCLQKMRKRFAFKLARQGRILWWYLAHVLWFIQITLCTQKNDAKFLFLYCCAGQKYSGRHSR